MSQESETIQLLAKQVNELRCKQEQLISRLDSLESQHQITAMLLDHIEEMYQPKPLLPLLLSSWFVMGGMLALLIWRWNG